MIENTGYQPTYIIQQEPFRFGGKQDDYLKRANQAIEQASQKIVEAKSRGDDLAKLFFELIDTVSCIRRNIAFDHNSEDAEFFGVRRGKVAPAGGTSVLALEGVYSEYNQKILSLFAHTLKEMELKNNSGTFKKNFKISDECMGRKSTLEFEIFDMNPTFLDLQHSFF